MDMNGVRSLPRTLIVPGGACGFTLQKHQTYLLSGLYYGQRPSQLYSSRCLLLKEGDPQLWNQVSPCTQMDLKTLRCPRKPTTFPANVT
ncbi:unnamed protein product, partial [Mesorhabditis belari]|uniref:Uncharacterized protein n=1 Tax=Mesorhabditis belari TaxID=2138241 RepID=A0AAF3EV07_9BILA